MDSECTSSRRLSFEDVNENQNEHVSNILDMNLMGNHESMINEDEDYPKIGMEFDTEEDSYQFYLKYAKRVGFGIRRSKTHNDKSGKLLDRIFCCSAEGKKRCDKRDIYVKKARPVTRFGCEAKMKIFRQESGNFCVVQFVEGHNHYLCSPNKTHLHRSHRKIAPSAALQIQMANDVGITPKASHDLMVRQVGGRDNLGFIPQDYRNYLRSKRTREMKRGDTGGIMEYMHKMQFDDPNFFYAIQVDEDDLVTNIFWADARMRSDYLNFGDVISFDTTYKKNNDGRPIALFVGVNHHKQTVIFGAALLYDETSLTFEWLFDTFTTAMREKKPDTILTDQDAAMAKALASKWPETYHRLCLWHIFQNAAIHLSSVFSQFRDFARDFGSCIYDFEEEEEFIAAWDKMLNKFALEDNDWLKRMFNLKEKWALVYGRQTFCADMTTTQRSESMNSVVKRYVTYQHKLLDFFNHFQRLLDDRRYEELKADFKANTSVPPLSYPIEILKHAASIYTPEVYKLFEQEWYKSHDSSMECIEDEESLVKYRITPHKKSHPHIVIFDSTSGKTNCSCRKFEFAGIICSHILKIFTQRSILKIPNGYILKRWTRKAKVGFFGDSNTDTCNLDPKMLQKERYKELCGLYVQLVTKASESEDTYMMIKDDILKKFEMVDERLHINSANNQLEARLQGENETSYLQNPNELQINGSITHGVKGIKLKKKTTSGKRIRGALEKASRKKIARRKDNQPALSPLPSNIEHVIEENFNTISNVPTMAYGRLNEVEDFSTSSSQYNFGSQFSMGMTSLLLAQQSLSFDSLRTNCSQQSTSLTNGTYASGASYNDKCECSVSCVEGQFCKCKQ